MVVNQQAASSVGSTTIIVFIVCGAIVLAFLVLVIRKLRRKTLSQGQVASVATMWHPGERYQFTGSF